MVKWPLAKFAVPLSLVLAAVFLVSEVQHQSMQVFERIPLSQQTNPRICEDTYRMNLQQAEALLEKHGGDQQNLQVFPFAYKTAFPTNPTRIALHLKLIMAALHKAPTRMLRTAGVR